MCNSLFICMTFNSSHGAISLGSSNSPAIPRGVPQFAVTFEINKNSVKNGQDKMRQQTPLQVTYPVMTCFRGQPSYGRQLSHRNLSLHGYRTAAHIIIDGRGIFTVPYSPTTRPPLRVIVLSRPLRLFLWVAGLGPRTGEE